MKKHLWIILAIMSLAASCTSESAQPMADTAQAQEQGRADAKALSDAKFTSDRDLHSALLAVKARQWQIRANGDSLQSEAYINAFRDYLSENDASLAAQIF